MDLHQSRRRGGLKITLSAKLVLGFVVVGVVPLVALGFYGYRVAERDLLQTTGDRLEDAAVGEGELIDRNLFQRYGDVQAFAANPMASGAPAQKQRIVDFLTTSYGFYDLMLIVGIDGRIDAVNRVDGRGEPLDSGSLIGLDVSDQEWFQVAISGDVPGGTYYTDADISPYVAEVYGEEMLGLAFTAPIYGPFGDLIGVWHNVASFDRVVSEVMTNRRQSFRELGLTSIETQVLRSDGLVLDDADPDVVLDLNLAEDGLGAAIAATGAPGSSGSMVETHLRRGIDQINGYAVSDGALGFEGYNWGILVRQDVSEAQALTHRLRNSIFVFALIAAVVVSAFGALLARSLSRPLKRNASKLAEVAQGDLSIRFDDRSKDEVGRMSRALNAALSSIGSTMAQIDQSAYDLSESSAELFGVSNEMSRSASDTSEQANEVSAAAEEIAVTSGTVTRAMDQMSCSVGEISDSTADAARMSSEAVQVTITTRDRMRALEASASDIGNVVNVITSIAEQTDLLALNATIEAARVGEAGKGFAVVANEVKALASQTSSATDEIQAKVEAIQNDAVGAVHAIAEISGLIERVNDASTTIAGAVEEQSATTLEITDSLQGLTAGTASISETIAAVADSARIATDGASRTSQSASHLSALAVELNALLARFRLTPDQVASVEVHHGALGSGQGEVVHDKALASTGGSAARPPLAVANPVDRHPEASRPQPSSSSVSDSQQSRPDPAGTGEPPITPGSRGLLEQLPDDLASAGWK